MEQSPVDPVALPPIDITYSKLADWLVDRKKIPADWRKKVASLRSRIAAASSTVPVTLDSGLQTLTPESTGYLEARRIRDLLVQAHPDSRNIFGRVSGPALCFARQGEWDGIVRAYEKELLHLGEAAQQMVQYTDYEIPYQKKQIAKIQQQLTDMERKEAEFKRNAAASAVKYEQACQELGIKGNDVRRELIALRKTLPVVYMEVVTAICNTAVGESVELYKAFVSYAHQEPGVESGPILPTLRELRDNPPTNSDSLQTTMGEGIIGTLETSKSLNKNGKPLEGAKAITDIDWNLKQDSNAEKARADEAPISIDWGLGQKYKLDADVDVENGGKQIEWDIGEVPIGEVPGEAEETGGIDWGVDPVLSGENAVGVDEGSIDSDNFWDLSISSARPETNSDSDFVVLPRDASTLEEDGGEISWDIDIDEAGQDELQQGGDKTYDQSSDPLANEASSDVEEEMGGGRRFEQTEYRNMLLNDLFELKSFVKQRVEELGRHETATLQNQVQAMAPAACFQHGSDALLNMVLHITAGLDLLTARKTRDLSLLVTSSRFLDRLESSLLLKKESQMKLLASSRDLCQKRDELRNSLILLWPKQEEAVKRTRAAKEHVQESLSYMHDRRPVNIIGTINTVLGLA